MYHPYTYEHICKINRCVEERKTFLDLGIYGTSTYIMYYKGKQNQINCLEILVFITQITTKIVIFVENVLFLL